MKVKKVRAIGLPRMKKMRAIAARVASSSYQNIEKNFVLNNLMANNYSNKTLDKMYNQLRSKKDERYVSAIFKINKNLTVDIKSDIRSKIRNYAYNNKMLIREAKKIKTFTRGEVIQMYDRTEFWKRANNDLLGSKAWEYERTLAKRQKRTKLRTLEKQAQDLFNTNKYAQKIVNMRAEEVETRNLLRIPLFKKM